MPTQPHEQPHPPFPHLHTHAQRPTHHRRCCGESTNRAASARDLHCRHHHPFDHIATELTDLHGKFEVVSTDVRLLKDQFERQTKELSGKIETETKSLFVKIEQTEKTLLEKFGDLFNQRFLKIVGVIVGAVPIMYGALIFLKKTTTLTEVGVAVVCAVVGIVIIVVTWVLTRQQK
jgi:hypothetical protein